MANNQWVADPNDPNRMTYTDEQGNVHVAVRDTGAQVQRDKSGNVTDVTFPNYKQPSGKSEDRRSWGDRFSDSWTEAGQRGSIGVISRNGLYYSGYGKEAVEKLFPNLSPEEQDKKRWELITATQRRMRDEANARRAVDPTWKPDRSFIQQVASGDWIPDLAGQIFGGFGPENAVAPGANTAQRVIGQGLIGGATNAASQGADIHAGVEDKFDPSQVGMDVLASMGGQALLEGIGKVAARGKNLLFGEDAKTASTPSPEKYVIPEEDRAGIEALLRKGNLDDIKAKYPNAVFGDNEKAFQWYLSNRGKWKKVNWTGEEPASTLELQPSESVGPNGEKVEVLPDHLDAGDGRGYREFRIRDENGDITHQGEIYDNGIVAGHGELPVDANFIRFAAKGQESLTDLAPGDPVDPTKSTGISSEIDPELAKEFDAEFGPESVAPDTPNTPITEETVARLTESLKKAGKATDEQKALNTQTRKERFQAVGKARHATSGEAGLAAEMAQLKGEFPKVVREPVRQDFSQEEVDGLFDAVKKHPTLSWGESIRARVGLYKLLDGHPISANEISLLGRVFPKDFVKAAMKHRSAKGKIGDIIGNTLNLPRSLMSSFDLSAPFRQAWFFSTKKEFWKALPGMFRQAFSEKTFQDVMKEIRLRPNYERMESSGLAFSDLSSDIHAREEAFISNYAEKIPGVGKIVRGSERGFTGFLNKVRADVFDDLAAKAKAAGHDIDDPQFLKDLSGFINNATGRGSLGKFSQAGPFLNGLFFSPRLISSRLSLLNPVYYATLDPFVRKEAIKQLMATSALSVSVLTLAAAGGLNVEADPRSTDFGKIRDGDTRYDVLGGFGQYITLFARLATNQQKNSKGKVDELGKAFGAPTRLDILGRFATGKASPIAGYTASYLRGKDPTGKPFEAGPQAMDLFIPLFLQDVRDVMADEGPEGLKKAIPSFFGIGVSAYNNAPAFDRLGQQNDKQGGRMPGGFFTGDPANKPVVDELARIEAATGKELYKPVSKKDVKDFQMTDEQFYNYQYYAGAYIREDLKQVFASPEYQQASEEDKVKMVKEVVKDQKANARDLLFPKQ